MLTILLIIWPFLLGLAVIPLRSDKTVKQLAFVGSLIELAFTILLAFQFKHIGGFQHQINIGWIKELGVNLNLGVDGLGLAMVGLTNCLLPLIIRSGFERRVANTKVYYSLILFMQFALVGVFVSLNAFVFYVFWELALIPIYFITLVWGGEHKIKITIKFFLYTLFGSLLMLFAFIYLYIQSPTHSFDLASLYQLRINPETQKWLFWCLFIGFAVKMPIFPFHTWQPATYTNSPTQGTMLLSGIMLKMGVFGAMRWLLPILPQGVAYWADTAMALSIIGLVYGSIIALKQNDLKTMIAYSSFAHVGLMGASLFTNNEQALQGVVVQMIAHGFNIVGLFYIVDIIQNRVHNRQIEFLGGIKNKAPQFAAIFLIILLGSIALPLTNGFVGEFLMLSGIFKYDIWYAAFAGLSVIFGAVYMLYAYQKVMLGETNSITSNFTDVTANEKWVLIPIVCVVLLMGILPNIILNLSHFSIADILVVVGR